MRRNLVFGIAASLLAIGYASAAVNGIAVCTKDGSGSLQYYGTQEGELWRHDIVNDEISHTKIHDGPCTRPVINPSGTKVAFIKNAKICIMDIDGGTATELATCHANSQIDFPHDDWIYFTMGSYHEGNSKYLKRVSSGGGSVQDVVTFNWRVSQLNISNDLTKAVMRVGDDNDGSSVRGTIIAYDMSGNGTQYRDMGGGSSWSCAGGLMSDGQHVMDGRQDPHEQMDIRKWSDASQVKTYTNQSAISWAPNSGSWTPSSYNHAIFHAGGATNSGKWICVAMGGSRDYVWDGQVLINWVDEECIVATKGMTGKFDHGDFWVGEPTEVLRVPKRSTSHVSIMGIETGSFGLTLKTSAGGNHRIEIVSPMGKTVRILSGNGAVVYTVPMAGLSAGVYCARMTAGADQQTERFCVQ